MNNINIYSDNPLYYSTVFQTQQYDLTPLTWLHSHVNILPSVTTTSSSSSSPTPGPAKISNSQDIKENEKVTRVTKVGPEEMKCKLGAPADTQASSQSTVAVLDLADNFKTEESKQLFLRKAI